MQRTALEEVVIRKIESEGPLSFHDFMEMALYYPDCGYYTSLPPHIGRNGDYYTSCTLDTVFGAMLARQFEEMWLLLGTDHFTIVECGAGTGALCRDILDYFRKDSDLYRRLQYLIVEKSSAMRAVQQQLLSEKVSWYSTAEELPSVTGCIFSNEMLDNFAVHQVVMQDQLMEVYVGYENDFCERLIPASPALSGYFADQQIVLPGGYRTEVNLEAAAWLHTIASRLQQGFLLTIDYGLASSLLYNDAHRLGTLLCYYHHEVNDCPYKRIGLQDITAHVNFTALYHYGLQYGLEYGGYTAQSWYLQSLGITAYIRQIEQDSGYTAPERNRMLSDYLRLMELGCDIKILLQQKNMPAHQYAGFSFMLDIK